MTKEKQTKGRCFYCGQEMVKAGLSKHLTSCPERLQVQTVADKKPGRSEELYHLQVQSADSRDFWLHLEMKGNATLEDLDHYLRAIWLECCGHMSAFQIGPYRYTQIFEDGFSHADEKPMDSPIHKLFHVGMTIPYEYDFGTTSLVNIKVVNQRTGKATTKNPIVLMARNNMPEVSCMECGQPAAWICLECLYEEQGPCELCDEHAEEHPHDEYGEPVPLVNSPRVGMCAYEGPAEPPY